VLDRANTPTRRRADDPGTAATLRPAVPPRRRVTRHRGGADHQQDPPTSSDSLMTMRHCPTPNQAIHRASMARPPSRHPRPTAWSNTLALHRPQATATTSRTGMTRMDRPPCWPGRRRDRTVAGQGLCRLRRGRTGPTTKIIDRMKVIAPVRARPGGSRPATPGDRSTCGAPCGRQLERG